MDLFFRINTVEIYLPPLHETSEDIPLFPQHLLDRNRARYRKQVKGLSPAAIHQMIHYSWPGNAREVYLGNPKYGVDLHPIDFVKMADACTSL